MLSESQLAMLRKEALVAIGCNISSSPRLIDVAFLGCAWTGERAGCFQSTIGNKKAGRLMLSKLVPEVKLDLETLETDWKLCLDVASTAIHRDWRACRSCNWHLMLRSWFQA